MALPYLGSTPSKLWNSYKIGLDVLNSKLNSVDREGERHALDASIDELLAPPEESRPTWERLFEAERRLIPLMSDDMVQADALRKFARGREAGLPETEGLETAFKESDTEAQRLAIHEQMVDSLQVHHFKRELERTTCRGLASNLNTLGIFLLLPTVVIIIALIYQERMELLAQYHIVLTMWFGLLGAYLSRMIAFQSTMLQAVPHEVLLSGFSVWSVLVRLIIGAMGALVIYLMIAGHVLGGEMFPNLADFRFFLPNNVAAQTGGFNAGIIGPPSPKEVEAKRAFVETRIFDPDFAKLLVWATIAGFSERLLPDRLATMTKSTEKAQSATAG